MVYPDLLFMEQSGAAVGDGFTGVEYVGACDQDPAVLRSLLDRHGLTQVLSAPDGMIAAIVRVNGGRLATCNLSDFETTGLNLTSPWDF